MVYFLRGIFLIVLITALHQEVWAENNSSLNKNQQGDTKEEYKEGLQDIGGGFKKVGISTGRFFDRALDKVRLGIKNSFQSEGVSTNDTKSLKKDRAIEEDLSETETPEQNNSKQAENTNTKNAANNNDDLIGAE